MKLRYRIAWPNVAGWAIAGVAAAAFWALVIFVIIPWAVRR